MNNLLRLMIYDPVAIWIKGIDEMKDAKNFLNEFSIKQTFEGLSVETLERFDKWISLMRDPEYNDVILDDSGNVFLPRNFIRLIPVIRWPLVKEGYERLEDI